MEEVKAVAPMFGVLDIVLLAGMAGFGVYWAFFRSDGKSEKPSNKGYTIQSVIHFILFCSLQILMI